MNSFLRWSAEVKALVGQEALQTMSRTADGYVCAGCDKPGKATRERTNIIVVVGDASAPPVVQLAHARCVPSQVVRVDGPTIDPTALPDDLDEEVHSLTVLWASADGPLAGLIIGRHGKLAVIHGSGDRDDPWLQFLLAQHWTLVLDDSQSFPVIDTCTVELGDDGGRVVVNDADRTVLLEPLPDPREEWVRAAADRGIVRVYAGDIDLAEAGNVPGAVRAAIAAGRVVGAYVPVACPR